MTEKIAHVDAGFIAASLAWPACSGAGALALLAARAGRAADRVRPSLVDRDGPDPGVSARLRFPAWRSVACSITCTRAPRSSLPRASRRAVTSTGEPRRTGAWCAQGESRGGGADAHRAPRPLMRPSTPGPIDRRGNLG